MKLGKVWQTYWNIFVSLKSSLYSGLYIKLIKFKKLKKRNIMIIIFIFLIVKILSIYKN